METQRARPGNVLPLPRWTIIIHGVQMLLAVIILGLDAYGIRWIPYNALIFSLVAVSRPRSYLSIIKLRPSGSYYPWHMPLYHRDDPFPPQLVQCVHCRRPASSYDAFLDR